MRNASISKTNVIFEFYDAKITSVPIFARLVFLRGLGVVYVHVSRGVLAVVCSKMTSESGLGENP